LHKHIFNLSPQMLMMGPVYVRPLVAGQKLDMSKMMMMIDNEEKYDNDDDRLTGSHSDFDCRWLHSLQCLAALFLLASCVPKHLFLQCVVGGDETLQLMTKLGIVFVTSNVVNDDELDEWVVPLIHLFPLEIPPVTLFPKSTSSSVKHGMTTTETVDNINSKDSKSILLMTDLHPSVLDMTSFDLESVDEKEEKEFGGGEGAVMYIGPDSLALIHHLHASLSNCILRNNHSSMMQQPQSSFGRILDVCSGSGVQALATIAMLESIKIDDTSIDPTAVVVDVNERALRFATFNAQLNGYGDKIVTVHAELLSGRILNNKTRCESLIDAALYGMKNLGRRKYQIKVVDHEFDILLANPPFIPVPPSISDCKASFLRGVKYIDDVDQSTPRYGLFSNGGTSGEDCLRAIVRMAPSLLKSNGGLLAVVSEFMNPPTPSSLLNITQFTNDKSRQHNLITKIKSWWGSSHAFGHGTLFTNEFAIDSKVYAERRALSYDPKDISVWKNHLNMIGIQSVSPGLLFVRTMDGVQDENRLVLDHHFVPKTDNGSIWTPTNFAAVNFTRHILSLS
jgi:methylase of polypeptide subunit release factors